MEPRALCPTQRSTTTGSLGGRPDSERKAERYLVLSVAVLSGDRTHRGGNIDQTIIAKSRIFWDRLMNLIYYLETRSLLEEQVSDRKSKRKAFFQLASTTPRWRFLEPYEKDLNVGLSRFNRHFKRSRISSAGCSAFAPFSSAT